VVSDGGKGVRHAEPWVDNVQEREHDKMLELCEIARLEDVCEDPDLQHLGRFASLLLSRHNDDAEGLVGRTNQLEKLEPVEPLYLRIEHDEVEAALDRLRCDTLIASLLFPGYLASLDPGAVPLMVSATRSQ